MNPHSHRGLLALVAVSSLFTAASVQADEGDWRHDLLEASGIASDPASIRAAMEDREPPGDGLRNAYVMLGSESFQEREQAHAEILAGGPAALDWLAQQPVPDDPEVRKRRIQIMRELSSSSPEMRQNMLSHAMRSLLDEETRMPGGGGVFYEWFGTPAEDCRHGYRLMRYVGPVGGNRPHVRGGRFIVPGQRPGLADQRLILRTADWPGTERLPEHLTLRVILGGTEGGSGGWHVGVSIGDVKTLFHPGFRNGAFRHEHAETHDKITQNTDMGFTPDEGRLYRMELRLDRADPERFSLRTIITCDEGSRFEDTTLIAEEHFGEFDSIALERSGRTGGDAIFEQLALMLREQ